MLLKMSFGKSLLLWNNTCISINVCCPETMYSTCKAILRLCQWCIVLKLVHTLFQSGVLCSACIFLPPQRDIPSRVPWTMFLPVNREWCLNLCESGESDCVLRDVCFYRFFVSFAENVYKFFSRQVAMLFCMVCCVVSAVL